MRVPRAPGGDWLDPIRALFADAKERAKWELSPLAIAALRSTMIEGALVSAAFVSARCPQSDDAMKQLSNLLTWGKLEPLRVSVRSFSTAIFSQGV
eukprot:3440217-Pyramimonas_sp.AAC.1